MNSLFESPIQIAIIGIIITAVLAGGWIQTGYRQLLYGAIAALVLAIGLLVMERMIVTDREAITTLLHHAAADVQRNDVEAVVRHFHSSRDDVIARARAEMPQYRFTYVAVKSIHEIRIIEGSDPPEAKVAFNVLVQVVISSQDIEHTVPRYLELTLAKEDGIWKITDYMHDDASRGFMVPQ